MPRERKKYSKRFKMEAIRMHENGEHSAHEVERQLGITPGLLGKWKTEFKQQSQKQEGLSGNSRLIDTEIRIRLLECEIATLKEDKEVLRRALDMFSKMADEILFHRGMPENIQWGSAPFGSNQPQRMFCLEKMQSEPAGPK